MLVDLSALISFPSIVDVHNVNQLTLPTSPRRLILTSFSFVSYLQVLSSGLQVLSRFSLPLTYQNSTVCVLGTLDLHILKTGRMCTVDSSLKTAACVTKSIR